MCVNFKEEKKQLSSLSGLKGNGVNLEGELTSPFQRSLPLAASPSRAGHESTPCDQGGIPLGSPDDRFPAASRAAYHPIVKNLIRSEVLLLYCICKIAGVKRDRSVEVNCPSP